MTARTDPDEPVFQYRANRGGVVTIFWLDRPVTTLRGKAATRFLMRIEAGDGDAAQLEMARVTGNFKRGNERTGRARERRKS
jgi:hypothetical protein